MMPWLFFLRMIRKCSFHHVPAWNSYGAFTMVLALTIMLICQGKCLEDKVEMNNNEPSETVHLFLLAVPESSIPRLSQRFRQDEEEATGGNFAQTGQYVGQIIQGVLGGDLRPVFAGSVKFVEEPMAAANLGSFLSTIAPALNLGLREIFTRAQTAFGFGVTTQKTPQAGGVSVQPEMIQQSTMHGLIGGIPSRGVGENGKNMTQAVEASTTSWQYVLNQIYSEPSTIAPLPFITRRTTESTLSAGGDGDDGDYDGRRV